MATHSAAPQGRQTPPQEDLHAVLERFEQWADNQKNAGRKTQNSQNRQTASTAWSEAVKEVEQPGAVEPSGRKAKAVTIGKGSQQAAHIAYQASNQIVREISYEEALARTHTKSNFDWKEEDEQDFASDPATPEAAHSQPMTNASSTTTEEQANHPTPPQTTAPQDSPVPAASALAGPEATSQNAAKQSSKNAASSKAKSKAGAKTQSTATTTRKAASKSSSAKATATATATKNKKNVSAKGNRSQTAAKSTVAADKAREKKTGKQASAAKASPRKAVAAKEQKAQGYEEQHKQEQAQTQNSTTPANPAQPSASAPNFQEVLASQLHAGPNESAQSEANFPPIQEKAQEGAVSITVHLSATERNALRQRAMQLGLTADAYLRQCALELESLRGDLQEMLVMRMQATRQLPAQASPARTSWFTRIKQRFFPRSNEAKARLTPPQIYPG